MSNNETPPEGGRSNLEDKLLRMGKVYEKFGRDGLKDFPLADVQLLLSSKELDLQAARSRQPIEQQATRTLTLEVQDIGGYIEGQLAAVRPRGGMTLAHLREHKPQQQYKPRDKGRGYER